jgi:hypothetical protein
MKTYSPKQVSVALGSHLVRGYADDSFISIEKNGDGVTKVVGCDGEVARSMDPDNSYRVTLTLMQTSVTNSFLQVQYDRDRETGEAYFPILVKDMKGGVVFQSDSAWVAVPAPREFGRTLTNRQWQIDTAEATLVEGS